MSLFSWIKRQMKKRRRRAKRGGGASSSSASTSADLISPPTAALPAPVSAITSSITMVTAQPPAQAVSSIPQPLDTTPTSLDPAPSSADPPTVSDTVVPPTRTDIDPWTRAYELVQEREGNTMADYKKHLASLQPETSGDLSTPQSVESIVKGLLEDREKKQWQVSLLGTDIKVRKQAERLTKFLLWSDPIVKAAVSAQPHAALAWTGVSLLLPLITSGTTQNEAMLKGFNAIGDLQMYWHICETTNLEPIHRQQYEPLIEPLAKLYSYVIAYQARVICHLSKAQLSRARSDVAGSNDWDGKIREINGMDKLCREIIGALDTERIQKQMDHQLQEMEESRTILNEIRKIIQESGRETRMNYEDQQEKHVLQDLASDYEGHKDFNPRRVPGTCEWFLKDDRFLNWRHSSASRLLWVSADPGCGKSVLSRALIDERLLSTKITTSTVCYFFFKDGDKNRMYAHNALCAILHQLFTHDPTGSLIAQALPSHKSFGNSLTENFSELWRIIEQCADALDDEVICVIDALDECHADSRKQLIEKLKEVYCQTGHPSKLCSKLKFLITSRPYDDIEASFKKFSDTTAYVRFDGDDNSAQISDEINLVIDARVDEIARDFEEKDRRKISERLRSMEHRTYLWLHLTLDIIEKSPSEYERVCDVETLLSNLPSKVSEAYERILDRSKNSVHTETLIQILLAAARPLTLDEVNTALTLALERPRFTSHEALKSKMWSTKSFKGVVKNLCGLLISVYDSKVSFIHQTAREFLLDPKQEGKWKGRFNDISKSHSTMSPACLHYLLLPDLETPARDEFQDQQYPFLPYAAAYWPSHYISQEAAAAEEFRKDVRMLCRTDGQQANIWMPVYFKSGFPSGNGWTDLALASYLGLEQVVQHILLEKTDIDMVGQYNYGTALQAAVARGHEKIVQILLDKDADVNIKGGVYSTALQAASATGHKGIIQILVDKGADVNIKGGRYGTALQAASAKGHKEIVQILLDKDADVNIKGGVYSTALEAASATGHKGIIQILVDKGADVNIKGGRYGTALQAASVTGYKGIVQILLDKGADVNIEGGVYGTALQAASATGHKGIIQILVDKGADINIKGGRYGTALQAASVTGHKGIVQILLDKDADINIKGGVYGTALQAASAKGHKEIVQILVDKCADNNLLSQA